MPADKRAVFRLDAGPTIGGGHLVRCFALTSALVRLGWRILFAVNGGAREAAPFVGDRIKFAHLPEDALFDPECLKAVVPQGCDLVVLDHYGLGSAYQESLRGWAGRICVIDDLADRPVDCDVLIDPSPGRRDADYRAIVPAGCKIMTGSSYALLRPEFPARRRASLDRRRSGGRARRVLISFGMTDPGNHSSMAVKALHLTGLPLSADVVIGGTAPHLGEIRNAIEAAPMRIDLHENTTNMADLMAVADIAVGGAGGSALERCCLGLPALSVSAARNQDHYLSALESAGAVAAVNVAPDEIPDAVAGMLIKLCNDEAGLRSMSEKAAAVCDGLGAERAARVLDTGHE